jgi:putative MATE family efflux protein
MTRAPHQADRAEPPLDPTSTSQRQRGVFTTGSTMRHVATMTTTVGVGLLTIFGSDILDLFFLAQIGDESVTAAMGFVGPIAYLSTSAGLGMAIATAALVSPAVGRGDKAAARRMATNAFCATLIVSALFAALVYAMVPTALAWLGATGRVHALATSYLRTALPTLPILALAMSTASMLRSVGDVRRATTVTVVGAVSFVVADVFAIFGLGLGIVGSALAANISRVIMLATVVHGALRVYRLLRAPVPLELADDILPIARIALPALFGNIAIPVANSIVVAHLSPYGDGVIAGWAIMARVGLIAYCLLFAMTPAISPILGQNHGIGDYARVRRTLLDSIRFAVMTVLLAWAILAATHASIAAAFAASSEAARIVALLSQQLAPLTVFLGALLIANAAFNALGRAHFATAMNWARATIGTIPFAIVGGWTGGAFGVIVGTMLGTAVFGTLALWLAFRLVGKLEAKAAARQA